MTIAVKNWFRRTRLWHSIYPYIRPFFRSLADPPYGIKSEYEPQVTTVMQQIVQPGWTCVDVGGYIGRFSVLLAELVGANGKVIVFEAYGNNAATIRRHVAALGFSARVRVENMALNDGTADKVWLYYGRGDDASEFNVIGQNVIGNQTARVQQVAAVSLDKYYAPNLPLHFVKMDIEGAEAQALVGMRRILREQKPFVLIEFHTDGGWAARNELYSAGYTLHDMENRLIRVHEPRVYHVLARPPHKVTDS